MSETAVAHITTRGNARTAIFLDDVDYLSFLRMLGRLVPYRVTAGLAECSWVTCEMIWELTGGPAGFRAFVAGGAELQRAQAVRL